VAVADQYLRAIHENGAVDHHALAEFVAIGAKLIYLKSKALLPRSPAEVEELLEEDEVGLELIDMLTEYRRYAEVADALLERQEAGLRLYARMAPPPVRPEGPGLDGVTLEAMQRLMLDVLKRLPEAPPKALIPRESVTLTRRLTELRARLKAVGRFSFREAILECRTRLEVVLSFLAVLELLKAGECDAVQDEAWGDIQVVGSR
jgi:segregation and condensation protein A